MPKDWTQRLMVRPGARPKLRDKVARVSLGWDKASAEQALEKNRKRLQELQYKMYADARHAVLVVLQGIDGAGKDGTLRHVMSAFNPQGCTVTSFKAPTAEELKRDFLWRIHANVPRRGEVGVFNRSHYEDVLVVRVDNLVPRPIWSARYDQINDFERMLTKNRTRIVKFFLHISKEEQRERFQARLDNPDKRWKYDPADVEKRAQWKEYGEAFEAALHHCSTEHAPWYLIPSDRKWFRNLAVSQILLNEMETLPLRFPRPSFDPKKVRL
jgi:PPK2 family polyphosphate:nucleotide phosphotransferase